MALTTLKINGDTLYLCPAGCDTWIATRDQRYSPEGFEYDPYMPHQTEAEERDFYNKYVTLNYFLLFEIRELETGELLGFIQAFEFKRSNSDKIEPFYYYSAGGSCETGIRILESSNFRRGIGSEAYRLFLNYLKETYNISKTIIQTHPDNERAKGLYRKLGYKDTGIVEDGPEQFFTMEYHLI